MCGQKSVIYSLHEIVEVLPAPHMGGIALRKEKKKEEINQLFQKANLFFVVYHTMCHQCQLCAEE